MFNGNYFQLKHRHQFAELVFDSQSDSVNTLCRAALLELEQAIALLASSDVKGLILRSGKKLFSAGADVKEFLVMFADGNDVMTQYLEWVHSVYNSLEDLDMPKVTLINGTVAGGGVELSLLTEYRLGTSDAKIGLPEVKLGIMPGWGGVTRLPRLIGLDTSLQWLTTGKNFKADKALEAGFLDGVVDPISVDPIEKAEDMLTACLAGDFDWQARRKEKLSPLKLSVYEQAMSLNVARGMVAKVAGKHYPAPMIILDTIERAAQSGRDKALVAERKGIVRCVESGVADALVNVFLSDMAVKSKARHLAKGSTETTELGVVGAGIMGGGIAFVSAQKGIDVVMKDIAKEGLDLGLNEANKLLAKQVSRGRIEPLQMGQTLNRITPTLLDASLCSNDLVIEAVVENPKVKFKVLSQLEQSAPEAVIASNTSSLAITGLAKALKKPEKFCGIHFFNPVHKMPLVEVIRGEKTSDSTIAKAVNYCLQLGKTPIVVNDCAGFFVNRVLTPFMLAFNQLLLDGGNIEVIDKVMKKDFGWPMGPAELHDVVGLDTAAHVMEVMSSAYAHMPKPKLSIVEAFYKVGWFGQKSGRGFFAYEEDRKGRAKQVNSEASMAMLAKLCAEPKDYSDEDITYRCMLPMMFEAIRCLDEGVIASPQEGDLAMIYGTGFPPFRGGIFYYMDQLGLANLLEIAQSYQDVDAMYQIPEGLSRRAKADEKFYG
ncbi:MAG: 3-hydroxyacyl-CoA dehydrogenase/enoyl-CoA hydratase/3-hydroxybutyryl-CoA epimerase [Moritella sp.]|jgi:3-hydroxyacyl-CoA dehydrogenase/enoyl-CoA hydratase/3-hydroxybutyryl-CoA epimerase/enoyl-CoA isomerase